MFSVKPHAHGLLLHAVLRHLTIVQLLEVGEFGLLIPKYETHDFPLIRDSTHHYKTAHYPSWMRELGEGRKAAPLEALT